MHKLLSLATITSALACQGADFSATGGGGFLAGEEQDGTGVVSGGVSLGWPYAGRHRVQLDYLFNRVATSAGANLHFVTASYVVQATAGRTRPFFQIGAGILRRSGYAGSADTDLAVVFGGGATIEMGRSFFLRPQVRMYGHVGPTITVVPMIAAGWRF